MKTLPRIEFWCWTIACALALVCGEYAFAGLMAAGMLICILEGIYRRGTGER